MASTHRVDRRGTAGLVVRQVLIATVVAWAAVMLVSMFFGGGLSHRIGMATYVVGVAVVALGIFDLLPAADDRPRVFRWWGFRNRSSGDGRGLTQLGVALFVAPVLFVVGTLLAP